MQNIVKHFVAKIIAASLVLGFTVLSHAESPTLPQAPQIGDEVIIDIQSENVNGQIKCNSDRCGIECAEAWKADRDSEKFVQCGQKCAESPVCTWNGEPVREVAQAKFGELSAKLKEKFGAQQAPPFIVPASSPTPAYPSSAGVPDDNHGIAPPPAVEAPPTL